MSNTSGQFRSFLVSLAMVVFAGAREAGLSREWQCGCLHRKMLGGRCDDCGADLPTVARHAFMKVREAIGHAKSKVPEFVNIADDVLQHLHLHGVTLEYDAEYR